jgi:hypothetical protein
MGHWALGVGEAAGVGGRGREGSINSLSPHTPHTLHTSLSPHLPTPYCLLSVIALFKRGRSKPI